jgi:hypothetical protein
MPHQRELALKRYSTKNDQILRSGIYEHLVELKDS